MDPIIRMKNVTKTYGENLAVNHLTLTIRRGEVFGLLGPNGAGKSTTILMMLGLTEPDEGEITVCGYHSTREPALVKQQVGYLPDNVGFYEDRTGLENLLYTAALNKIPYQEARIRATRLLKQVGLEIAMHKKTGKYSRGMKQRLGLADVLIKNPKVVILDEPTLGLDPQGVEELLILIKKLSKEQGITVLLSSHQLHQVQQICDRVGLFVNGKLVAEGQIADFARELFSTEGHSIYVKVSSLDGELLDEIRQLDDVLSVELTGEQTMLIKSKKDITALLATYIIQAGALLHEISIKEHGLDDIYKEFFEGGNDFETSSPFTRD